MLLIQNDCLVAVTGFCNHFHVGLLVDHGGEAISYHRMIICKDHPDFPFQYRDHHTLRFGSRTLTRVPAPGLLSICHSPPMAPARCCMLVNPNPSPANSACCSMPTPSSATDNAQCAGSSVIVIRTLLGRA